VKRLPGILLLLIGTSLAALSIFLVTQNHHIESILFSAVVALFSVAILGIGIEALRGRRIKELLETLFLGIP
jgi:hypothetical protein